MWPSPCPRPPLEGGRPTELYYFFYTSAKVVWIVFCRPELAPATLRLYTLTQAYGHTSATQVSFQPHPIPFASHIHYEAYQAF